jgi:hypothetical protein
MSYDDERTNRLFTIFCYGLLIALIAGASFGALITYLLVK